MDGHVERIEVMIKGYIWLETFRGRGNLTNPRLRKGGGIIKWALRKEDCEDIQLVPNRIEWQDLGWL